MNRRSFISSSFARMAAVTAALRVRGAPAGPNRLIVRGDDMGFSHGANLALIQCHRDGIETTIEVLAPGPWFPEAVRLLNEPDNRNVDVGIHLCLTSEWDNLKWRSLTAAPSLVDHDGWFFPLLRPNPNFPGRSLAEQKWQIADIEREFRAQIELVRKHVPRVSHVTSHMGCTGLAPEVSAMTRRLAQEFGIDIDLPARGVKQLRYVGTKETPAERLASFLAALASMEPGGTYWFVGHPSLDTPELRAIGHRGDENVAVERQAVTDTWTHPKVKTFIRERGIQLIGYRDLARQ